MSDQPTANSLAKRPKWQRAAFWLLTFVVVVALLLGFRTWRSGLEQAPVDAIYRDFLNDTAKRSPSVDLYLKRYYERHARDTVAARDFSQVCASVTALADRDQVALQSSPWHTLSEACRRPMTEDAIHILP